MTTQERREGTDGLYVSMMRFGDWAMRNVEAARKAASVTELEHAERMALALPLYRQILAGKKLAHPSLVELFATSIGHESFRSMVAAMDKLHGGAKPSAAEAQAAD